MLLKILLIILFGIVSVLVLLTSCYSDSGEWVYHKDGNYGPKHWHSELKPSDGPSASAPESLKPYYDPELTEALNQ